MYFPKFHLSSNVFVVLLLLPPLLHSNSGPVMLHLSRVSFLELHQSKLENCYVPPERCQVSSMAAVIGVTAVQSKDGGRYSLP